MANKFLEMLGIELPPPKPNYSDMMSKMVRPTTPPVVLEEEKMSKEKGAATGARMSKASAQQQYDMWKASVNAIPKPPVETPKAVEMSVQKVAGPLDKKPVKDANKKGGKKEGEGKKPTVIDQVAAAPTTPVEEAKQLDPMQELIAQYNKMPDPQKYGQSKELSMAKSMPMSEAERTASIFNTDELLSSLSAVRERGSYKNQLKSQIAELEGRAARLGSDPNNNLDMNTISKIIAASGTVEPFNIPTESPMDIAAQAGPLRERLIAQLNQEDELARGYFKDQLTNKLQMGMGYTKQQPRVSSNSGNDKENAEAQALTKHPLLAKMKAANAARTKLVQYNQLLSKMLQDQENGVPLEQNPNYMKIGRLADSIFEEFRKAYGSGATLTGREVTNITSNLRMPIFTKDMEQNASVAWDKGREFLTNANLLKERQLLADEVTQALEDEVNTLSGALGVAYSRPKSQEILGNLGEIKGSVEGVYEQSPAPSSLDERARLLEMYKQQQSLNKRIKEASKGK